jgi:transposase-like protein
VPSTFQSTNPIFHDEHTARMALEALRWPDGPVCPKSSCGASGPALAKMGGEKQSHRDGLYRCKACRGQFTVTVGTIFERSKVPLRDWLRAIHMFSSNKLGPHVTIREVELELDVTYKTALQIWKRICGVLRTYKGHNKGFGSKITAFISSKRPKPKWRGTRAYWSDKNRRLLKGEVSAPAPKATGLLSSFKRAQGPADNLDRTERLLRLLMAAGPKRLRSIRRTAATRSRLKRGTVPSVTP